MDIAELLYTSTEAGYYERCLADEGGFMKVDLPAFDIPSDEDRQSQDATVKQILEDARKDYRILPFSNPRDADPTLVAVKRKPGQAPDVRKISACPDPYNGYSPEAYPGNWASVSFSSAMGVRSGVCLIQALLMMGSLPTGIDKFICFYDDEEVLEKLESGGVICLYTENYSEHFKAILPGAAVEPAPKSGFESTTVQLVSLSNGIRIRFEAVNQAEIDDYLVRVLCHREIMAIRYVIETQFNYIFTDGKASSDMYRAMAGEGGEKFVDGTEDGARAVSLTMQEVFPVESDYPVHLGGLIPPAPLIELPMTPQVCRDALEKLKRKYQEADAVFSLWKKALASFGLFIDREKVTPSNLNRLRDMLGIDTAIEAFRGGVPVEDLSF